MQEVYKPRGVVIDEILLINYDKKHRIDLSYIFIELNIYEDIFQSQIVGDITLQDTNELIETFPIVGEETIRIRWHLPNSENKEWFDTFDMRVYKVGDRSVNGLRGGKSSTYKLYFTSKEAITNLSNTVSRSFNTKTASEIATIIYNDYLDTNKEFIVEKTEGVLKEVIPNWKPFRAINWLAGERAITEQQNADFFFFESLNKNTGPRFNFVSLTSLMQADSVFDVEFMVQNLFDGKTKDMTTASFNVDSFEFPKHGNFIDNITNGMYAQTWIYHDPLRKRFVVSKPTHEESVTTSDGYRMYSDQMNSATQAPTQFIRMPGNVDAFPKLLSNSSIDNSVDKTTCNKCNRNEVEYIAKREATDEKNTSSMVSSIASKRAFRLQELNNYSVSFGNIPGNQHIQLGSVITFNKPHLVHNNNLFNDKLSRFDDRFLSGKYLVTRLRHTISIEKDTSEFEYSMALDAVKTSFPEKITHKEI